MIETPLTTLETRASIQYFVMKAIFDPNYGIYDVMRAKTLRDHAENISSLVDSIVGMDLTNVLPSEKISLPESRADLIAWLQELPS